MRTLKYKYEDLHAARYQAFMRQKELIENLRALTSNPSNEDRLLTKPELSSLLRELEVGFNFTAIDTNSSTLIGFWPQLIVEKVDCHIENILSDLDVLELLRLQQEYGFAANIIDPSEDNLDADSPLLNYGSSISFWPLGSVSQQGPTSGTEMQNRNRP